MSTYRRDSLPVKSTALLILSILFASHRAEAQQLQWVESPLDGHWYAETTTLLNWDAAEALAVSAGGHLASIGSAEENTWIFDTFGASPRFHWIGLSDAEVEGSFGWSSGEAVTFTNWAAGEPNNANGGEDHVVLDATIPYQWNDIPNAVLDELAAIVELESDDCDSNGVPDTYEISLDGSLDANSNGFLDSCEPPTIGIPMCLGDGTDGLLCPCQNPATVGPFEGCANSTGRGATLLASGSNSLVLDDLVLSVTFGRPHQPAVVIQGSSPIQLPFKDGKLCMGFPTDRLEVLSLDGTGADSTASSIATQGNVASSGTTTFYQVWYRDPQLSPCGTGSNLSNGLQIDWI